MGNVVRHPIIVDTDALIAVANTFLWPRVLNALKLTTTNVCVHELNRHIREKSPYAPEGTREHWVHKGSETAVKPFDDDDNPAFTVVPCVPRPHGNDAGEESIRREIEQNPGQYKAAILMDEVGRNAINDVYDSQAVTGRAVAPPYLLYLLWDTGNCTKREFCEACSELIRGEGWTGYKAIQAAWEAIPVDCSPFISSELLP